MSRLTGTDDNSLNQRRIPGTRSGVEKLWRATRRAGDLYRKHYEGRYRVG